MPSRRAVLGGLAVSLLPGQESTRALFGNADAYERFVGRWSRLLAPMLVDFAGIPNQGRVLDIGSGTGSLTFEIARTKPRSHVVGIDLSDGYVAYAASRNTFPGRVEFRVGDAQGLPFPDAMFEGSASLLVFNFIPDPRKALDEARRVTRPGRRISAAVWDYASGMRMLRVFWDAAASIDAGAHDERNMRLGHSGELAELWKQGGLAQVEARPLDITMRFASFADYWEPFLLGQGPAGAYVRKLDRERLELLRGEVRRRLPIDGSDGPFSLGARAWAVRGTVPGRS